MGDKWLRAAAVGLCFLGPPAAFGAQWAPTARLDAYAGELIFDDRPSFSGLADWLFLPALKPSESDSLLPTFTGQYRKIREVHQIASGGSLSSQTLDNAFLFRWVHALDDKWSLKPDFSYKNEL